MCACVCVLCMGCVCMVCPGCCCALPCVMGMDHGNEYYVYEYRVMCHEL